MCRLCVRHRLCVPQHACEQLDRQLQLQAAELAARGRELQKSHEAHQAEMDDMYIKVRACLVWATAGVHGCV